MNICSPDVFSSVSCCIPYLVLPLIFLSRKDRNNLLQSEVKKIEQQNNLIFMELQFFIVTSLILIEAGLREVSCYSIDLFLIMHTAPSENMENIFLKSHKISVNWWNSSKENNLFTKIHESCFQKKNRFSISIVKFLIKTRKLLYTLSWQGYSK